MSETAASAPHDEIAMLNREVELVAAADLIPHPRNPRHGDVGAIVESIRHNGFYGTLLVQRSTGYVCAGNHRLRAARELGMTEVPVIFLDVSDDVALQILLADNRTSDLAAYDDGVLADLLTDLASRQKLAPTGWSGDDLDRLLSDLGQAPLITPGDGEAPISPAEARTLADRFIAPPFSVLDARAGYWRQRKRAWLALGIRSAEGRPRNLLSFSDTVLQAQQRSMPNSDSGNDPAFYWKKREVEAWLGRTLSTEEFTRDFYERDAYVAGTSIFDPVLCEIVYHWWCPPGGRVLDPFAGGSVRGAVAAACGLPYLGVELRQEQIAANEEQWPGIAATLPEPAASPPRWQEGDAADLAAAIGDETDFDLLFTCPPFFDLEPYSDDPRDLSNLPPAEFVEAYGSCLRQAFERLADNRFAVLVVGNVRDPDGNLRDLAAITREIAEGAGLAFYNDAILLTSLGSLPLRAARIFRKRKLGRTHQQVLVFLKGDVDEAVAALPDVDEQEMGAALAVETVVADA